MKSPGCMMLGSTGAGGTSSGGSRSGAGWSLYKSRNSRKVSRRNGQNARRERDIAAMSWRSQGSTRSLKALDLRLKQPWAVTARIVMSSRAPSQTFILYMLCNPAERRRKDKRKWYEVRVEMSKYGIDLTKTVYDALQRQCNP